MSGVLRQSQEYGPRGHCDVFCPLWLIRLTTLAENPTSLLVANNNSVSPFIRWQNKRKSLYILICIYGRRKSCEYKSVNCENKLDSGQTVFLIMTRWRTVRTVLIHGQVTLRGLDCIICVCFSYDSRRRRSPQWSLFYIVALHKIKRKSLD